MKNMLGYLLIALAAILLFKYVGHEVNHSINEIKEALATEEVSTGAM